MWTKEQLLENMTNPVYTPKDVLGGIFTYMAMSGIATLLLGMLILIWFGAVATVIDNLIGSFVLVGVLGGVGHLIKFIGEI